MPYKIIKRALYCLLKGYVSNLIRLFMALFYFFLVSYQLYQRILNLTDSFSVLCILIFAIQIFATPVINDASELMKFYCIEDFFEKKSSGIEKIDTTKQNTLIESIFNIIILLAIFCIFLIESNVANYIALMFGTIGASSTLKAAIHMRAEIFFLLQAADKTVESMIINPSINPKDCEKIRKAKRACDNYKLYESAYLLSLCLLFFIAGIVDFYFSRNFFSLTHSAYLGLIFSLIVSNIVNIAAATKLVEKDRPSKSYNLKITEDKLSDTIDITDHKKVKDTITRPIKVILISRENENFLSKEDYLEFFILLNAERDDFVRNILNVVSEKNTKEIIETMIKEGKILLYQKS